MIFSHKYKTHSITPYSHIPLDQVIPYKEGHFKACIDLNYYYAQVEERDRGLEGFPIIVGGWRNHKNNAQGIVATSNYVARSFGIKTGMSAFEAQKLCPNVIMFQVDYEKYEALSFQLRSIYSEYSPSVEPFSIDEVFLELTGVITNKTEALDWVMAIKQRIWDQMNLTINIGVSTTKSFAKIIVDMHKPNGYKIIMTDADIFETILPLPVESIMGIGRKRQRKLNIEGIYSMGQLAFSKKAKIQRIFGHCIGENFWLQARGEADSVIDNTGKEKRLKHSATHMHTFPHATLDEDELWGESTRGVEQVCYRLRAHSRKARLFCLIFRPQSMNLRRSEKMSLAFRVVHTNQDHEVMDQFKGCFDQLYLHAKQYKIEIRGIGVFGSELKDFDQKQLELFPETNMKRQRLYDAVDNIRDKGKFNIIQFGTSKASVKGRTHFIERCE